MENKIEYYQVESNEGRWRSIRFYCADDARAALVAAEALRDRLGTYEFTVIGIPYQYGGIAA